LPTETNECVRDTSCDGGRICEERRCVFP
jgi:hypothetical protein